MSSEDVQEGQSVEELKSTGDSTSTSASPKNLKGRVKGAKRALESAGVLPKIHPVPWTTFVVLLIFVSVPPVGFTYFFSSIGQVSERSLCFLR